MTNRRRGFSVLGTVVGQTLRSRHDQKSDQVKGNKVTMGTGVPRQAQGTVGDITVRDIPIAGLRAYIKTNNGWVDLNSMVARDSIEWIDMNLTSSWAPFGAAFTAPQYSKDANGFVHFRGTMKDGSSASATITTLPPGFRPPKTIVCALPNNGTWDGGQGSFQVTGTGVVNMPNGGDTDKQALDGVSFFAWQSPPGGGGGKIDLDPGSGGGALP